MAGADPPGSTSLASFAKAMTADAVGGSEGEGGGEDEGGDEGEAEGGGEAGAEGEEEAEDEGLADGPGSAYAGDITATRLEPTKTAPRAAPARRRPGVSGELAADVDIGAFSSSRMTRQNGCGTPGRGEFRRA
ncbi:hypothetical protein A6A08_14560 [Nocardiopsis sp. TSRI0078]|nr:hypothetical protein A6A08_14560 [Nocardiopsis sp. TSRI0078]